MDKSYVSHLECSISGKQYEANKVHGLSEAGRPLLVKYDLYKKMIEDGYSPQIVFEDKATVVEMWKSIGLRCLRV